MKNFQKKHQSPLNFNNQMELAGKIIDILPSQEGEGKNGTWKKQLVIIENGDKFPRKVCITLWGDLAIQEKSCIGKEVEASINLESQENNGRWYTDVKAWKFKILCLLLLFGLFSCSQTKNKELFLGEWYNKDTHKFMDKWVFTKTDEGQLHAQHLVQDVEKYPAIKREYATSLDESGNIVIHGGMDIKGNVSDDKLYLLGRIYHKYGASDK
ncbi:DUF3127 domain-containing protein [Runella sp. MFBS21]|uniref:DUF3127 domain-containing protein n=1 Tax=Runella sp. MFBS21 TaxID=3034018 RepID=UPI0023FA2F77|nr:DUF3127 domain-containing protein [Runella sp. MFBS21]MDF7821870.1 DUF3127 domain-containing protein [Runella sp. MFBS21]